MGISPVVDADEMTAGEALEEELLSSFLTSSHKARLSSNKGKCVSIRLHTGPEEERRPRDIPRSQCNQLADPDENPDWDCRPESPARLDTSSSHTFIFITPSVRLRSVARMSDSSAKSTLNHQLTQSDCD
eukprot:g37776.t1